MKNILFLIMILSYSVIASAQNYQCLPHPGTINWFINNENYLRGIRIDSVTVSGADTIYYPYHTPRSAPMLYDTSGSSWLGKKVVEQPDGTFLFDNAYNDTVVIKTLALLGDNWVLYNDSGNKYYVATVTAIDTMTIQGTLDSIKKITIHAYDPAPDTLDSVDNFVFILSKNHGFAQICDLYNFPYHSPHSLYVDCNDPYFLLLYNLARYSYLRTQMYEQLFSIVSFQVPTMLKLYDYHTGDAFEYSTGTYCGCNAGADYEGHQYDSVISRVDVDSTHAILVMYEYLDTYWTQCMDTAKPHHSPYTEIDTIRLDTSPAIYMPILPEEYGQEYEYYYYPTDTTFCYTGERLMSDVIFLFEGCDNHKEYKNGIGIVDTDFCVSGLCDGTIGYDNATGVGLIYSRKNGIACGSFVPLGIESAQMLKTAFTISPNPANDLLTITKTNDGRLYTYVVVNTMGQRMQMFQSTESHITINVHDYPPGLYCISIMSTTGIAETVKVMVVH